MPDAQEIIRALGLVPHPIEGGFFRETYRSTAVVPSELLPDEYRVRSVRSMGTAIYYMLTRETFSEMHRVPTEEVFHLYLGGPARMLQLFPDGHALEIVLGTDLLAGERPQVVVPAGRRLCSPGRHHGARIRLRRLRTGKTYRADRPLPGPCRANRAPDQEPPVTARRRKWWTTR
jgi:predicted cupin superfamily sugar epimerase